MTLTVDISPETAAWLEVQSKERGQERIIVARMALEAFTCQQREE